MPKRTDISSILIIGSGPIVIGQACEFDYSGTQAIRALRQEGYRVILVNSNPATIMTDPDFADATYIEPLTPHFVEEVIAKERPDAVLPTMGGQTALNIALALDEAGVFERYGCELIGARPLAIRTAEDRNLFRLAMDEIGLESAKSGIAHSVKDAEVLAGELGFPLILRPSRTLGGAGGGVVEHPGELVAKVSYALQESPTREVLIEQSLLGWKEIELEVVRDTADNCVIICSIENIDPMGVHTGDSITVAPIQTLTDKEYQILRDAAFRIIRRIGVETGGSNVQFAINPKDGRVIVVEMNPRVSRSSALASKATGFPIAKIAAKLAVGLTLDEIRNDITRETPACFEPSIDYVVVKIPRFNFEKFPSANPKLGTQMKSVGEVLSFGRNFSEALQKAINSIELDTVGFDGGKFVKDLGLREIIALCEVPSPRRLWFVAEAFRAGASREQIAKITAIDPWYLVEIEAVVAKEVELSARYSGLNKDSSKALSEILFEEMFSLKRDGFSDARLATLLGVSESAVRARRHELGVRPTYRVVDTCAAEFVAHTPYLYSTYDEPVQRFDGKLSVSKSEYNEAPPTVREKVIILGSGPNRIGQGIEFDYCCVHAVMAVRDAGYEAILINCNPETVSTDYDVSDRLYFEPLTVESVVEIVERERLNGVVKGVIVQFGGQTPLKLVSRLEAAGVPILGTSVASIDAAEDREQFSSMVNSLQVQQPTFGLANSVGAAVVEAERIGFPVMIRPSFVLGGRAMRVIHASRELEQYIVESVEVSNTRPVLIDRFLEGAIEVDVDAVCDGNEVVITGVMEHIERAGIHSGDSSCVLPPYTLPTEVLDELERQTVLLARELSVRGLLNVQFAVDRLGARSSVQEAIYILEANPRASRTVPFVSKATGIPWAKIATRVMLGESLSEVISAITNGKGLKSYRNLGFTAVKACVFPFRKFRGEDLILGPEMKSTGEVTALLLVHLRELFLLLVYHYQAVVLLF
jgi:carbamoyl-phosphate synthase large subunit